MSRYVIKPVIDGKEYEVAYGFDRPLQEYFIQVFDNSLPDVTIDDDGSTMHDDVHCILWEGSRMTCKSNGEMLELYEEWGITNKKHLSQLAWDLPF